LSFSEGGVRSNDPVFRIAVRKRDVREGVGGQAFIIGLSLQSPLGSERTPFVPDIAALRMQVMLMETTTVASVMSADLRPV
jgi:hypothetical protein